MHMSREQVLTTFSTPVSADNVEDQYVYTYLYISLNAKSY